MNIYLSGSKKITRVPDGSPSYNISGYWLQLTSLQDVCLTTGVTILKENHAKHSQQSAIVKQEWFRHNFMKQKTYTSVCLAKFQSYLVIKTSI